MGHRRPDQDQEVVVQAAEPQMVTVQYDGREPGANVHIAGFQLGLVELQGRDGFPFRWRLSPQQSVHKTRVFHVRQLIVVSGNRPVGRSGQEVGRLESV